MPSTDRLDLETRARPSGPPGRRRRPKPPPRDFAPPPRPDPLPIVGAIALLVLALLALHLALRLRGQLEEELAGRLRTAATVATDVLVREEPFAAGPLDAQLLVRLDEVRRATGVSEIVLYDHDGKRRGDALTSAVPRRIRVPAVGRDVPPADASMREPERDPAGGLTLVVPTGSRSNVGAVLVRIDREGRKGLATVDFLFQVARILGGVLVAAGALVLLRRTGRSPEPAPPALRTDVDVVLGTMKEVVTTLKDSEIEYRDRWTAAEADVERYRATNDLILDSITSGIVAFDATGRITLFNAAAEEILGVGARTALGRGVSSVFGAEDRISRLADDLLRRQKAVRRVELERADEAGESGWIGVASSVIRRADGTAAGGIFLIADLTETRRLREQAGLKDRLSAVGEMSAGIAHEIKNALHSIMGFANLLRDDHGRDPPLAVTGILSEVDSLEKLVQGILTFSKPGSLLRERASVNDVLRDVERALAEPAGAAGVRVETRLSSEIPEARIDVAAIRRAFLNLALNAIEAMPDGGELTLATRLAESQTEGDEESPPARVLRVAFRDTGPGIAERDRARVFTPFHSTKRHGSGLGLALVHRTVTDHGGRIHLHSRMGVGTEFLVHLPVEDE